MYKVIEIPTECKSKMEEGGFNIDTLHYIHKVNSKELEAEIKRELDNLSKRHENFEIISILPIHSGIYKFDYLSDPDNSFSKKEFSCGASFTSSVIIIVKIL